MWQDKSKIRLRMFSLTLPMAVLALLGCTTPEKNNFEGTLASTLTRSALLEAPYPGCLEMLASYCGKLYSPKHPGNIDIEKAKKEPLRVRMGKAENGAFSSRYAYASAVLSHKESLPKDLTS